MSNYKQGGLERKYSVRKIRYKTDGSVYTIPVDKEADYFVLRLDKDPHAIKAIEAYTESVKVDNMQLATDLIRHIRRYK